MEQTIAIRLEGLVAGRGDEPLCGPLDLALGAGESLTVTGENGAGKSTLIRTLAGLVSPVAGRVVVEGAIAPDGEPANALSEISHYVGHRNAGRSGETLAGHLRFWHRALRGGGDRDEAVTRALRNAGLEGLEHLALGHLSAGQQRRAALARLTLATRPVWLLDEPTGALDEASRARFARIAEAHLAEGGIVVAATHMPLGFAGRRLDLSGPRGGSAA